MKIISPMAWGNGAYVVHRSIELHIPGYEVLPYNPWLTLFPLALRCVGGAKNAADLIHTTADYGVFFKKRKIPLVVSFHNYVLDKWMRPYCSFLQKIHYATDLLLWTLLSVNIADRITAVSHYTADMVKKDLRITKPIGVIYNGVDEKMFAPSKARNFSNGKIRVFFSGNLTLRKGGYWLPEIADRLSADVEIHFTQGLRKKGFVETKKNMVPIGPIPFKNMPDRYREMDILIMPTVREGFGLSIAEAMSCGLPVVASNCSSIPELIDDGKGGYLCPVGDVGAFADKINILAESPKLRKEMGEYNRAKVEKMFTAERMIKEYMELFEEILGRGDECGYRKTRII
jgi:L-malate glycosyltransferase